MATLDQLEAKQANTPTVTIEKIPLGNINFETLIRDFESSGDINKSTYLKKLKDIYATLGKENQESFLGILQKLHWARSAEELQEYMTELDETYEAYLVAHASEVDKAIRKKALMGDEFLDESDWPFADGIKWTLEDADSMNIEKLIEAAKSIELSGKIEWAKAWDDFFADLRNDVPWEKFAEFDAEIEKFKKENKDLYESSINTSDTGKSLDVYISDLESGKLDKQLQQGLKIEIPLEWFLSSLGISMGGEKVSVWPFHSKEEAIRMIYKIKLMFQSLEVSGQDMLSRYWLSVLRQSWGMLENAGWNLAEIPGEGLWWAVKDLLDAGAWAILAGLFGTLGVLAPAGALVYLWAAPLESAARRIKDTLAQRFGDKGWGKHLKTGSEWIGKWNDFFGTQAIAWLKGTFALPGKWNGVFWRMYNIVRLAGWTGLWTVTKPFDVLLGTSGSLLEGAEKVHLDSSNLLTDKIVLLDGLQGNVGNSWIDNATSNEAIEIRTRVKILTLLKRVAEYEGDAEMVKRIDNLWKTSLNSNTESFYIDVRNIIGKKYSDGTWKTFGKNALTSISEVFMILNKKEWVHQEYRDKMERMSQMLNIIYKKVDFDHQNWKVSIPDSPEYTDFFKYILSDVDLSLISNEEEERREKLLKDLIEEIKKFKVGFLTPDELKEEIRKIAVWNLPKFKILQEIVSKRKTLVSSPSALANLEVFRKMVLDGKWFWTPDELREVFNDIGNTIPGEYRPDIRTLADIEKEWKNLSKKSLRDARNFAEVSKLEYYKGDIKMLELMGKTWAISINVEERKRQLRYLLEDVSDTTKKLDWTVPEFHYAVEQILIQWKRYDERKDGRFGNAIELDTMFQDYVNFDTLRDTRLWQFIQKVKWLDWNAKLTIMLEVENDDSLKSMVKSSSEYFWLKSEIGALLKGHMSSAWESIRELTNRRLSAIGSMIFDNYSWESNSIKQSNDSILGKIQKFESEYQNLQKWFWVELWDKITFVMDTDRNMNALNQELQRLESAIEIYMRQKWSSPKSSKSPVVETEKVVVEGTKEKPTAPVRDKDSIAAPAETSSNSPIETPRETYDRVRGHLEGISYSIYSSGNLEAIKKFEQELKRINQPKNYANLRRAAATIDLWDYYKSYFGVPVSYMEFDTIKAHILTNTKLTATDTKFAQVQNLTDLWKYVAWLTDTKLKTSIEGAIKNFKITK